MTDKIIFLDFDGVLHPMPYYSYGWDFFICMPHLIDLLSSYDNYSIVLTTSWRESAECKDDLHNIFPKNIADRIIGVTPIHSDNMRPGARQAEIEDWLKINNREHCDFIAVDDMKALFSENFPLALCNADARVYTIVRSL